MAEPTQQAAPSPEEIQRIQEQEQSLLLQQQIRQAQIANEQAKKRKKQSIGAKIEKARKIQKIITFVIANWWWLQWVLLVIGIMIILGAIILFVVILLGYAKENPCEFLKIAGEVTGKVVLKALGVSCSIIK